MRWHDRVYGDVAIEDLLRREPVRLDRRRFLELMGAGAGAAFLAACGGSKRSVSTRGVTPQGLLAPVTWFGQSALPARNAPYEARSTPNPTASPARKTHIPSFPQLSGVRGDSAGSTAGWCSVAA